MGWRVGGGVRGGVLDSASPRSEVRALQGTPGLTDNADAALWMLHISARSGEVGMGVRVGGRRWDIWEVLPSDSVLLPLRDTFRDLPRGGSHLYSPSFSLGLVAL